MRRVFRQNGLKQFSALSNTYFHVVHNNPFYTPFKCVASQFLTFNVNYVKIHYDALFLFSGIRKAALRDIHVSSYVTITINQLKYFILSAYIKNCNHFNCRIRQLKGEQLLKCSNCETAALKFTYLLFRYTGYSCAKCGNVSKFCDNMNFVCWKWSRSKLNFWTLRVSLTIHVNYWEGRGTVDKNGSSSCIL